MVERDLKRECVRVRVCGGVTAERNCTDFKENGTTALYTSQTMGILT